MELELPEGVLDLSRVKVMAILNTTPDSFSDGGRYVQRERAIARSFELASEGADIIDIGGEKAGPGARVTVEEELQRVIPVIEAVAHETGLPVSVDTRRPHVARAAMQAGASIINSISGFDDEALRQTAADTNAAIVIMHIQGQPRVAHPHPVYDDVTAEVTRFLAARSDACIAAGVQAQKIVIDPGPDFGKTTEHSVTVVREIACLTRMPFPVLLAVSRKRFIGDMLDTPVEERLEGSLALLAWGVLQGIKIARVHDVRASKRVITMTEAVMHPEEVRAQ